MGKDGKTKAADVAEKHAAKKQKKEEVESESEEESSNSASEESEQEEEEEEEEELPHKAAKGKKEPEPEEAAGEEGDEHLECKDCGSDFIFSAGEKEFYASKGFDNKPVRCKACKDAKKDRMNGGGDRGSFGGRGAGRGAGGDRGAGACYAFQKGECDRGSSCRFSHGGSGGGGGGGRGGRGSFGGDRGGRGGGGGGGGGTCYAFQKGDCNRGSACRFSH